VVNARQTVAVLVISALSWAAAACQSSGSATDAHPGETPGRTAPVLQPGKPGEPNIPLTGRPATPLRTPAVDPDDARFMQEMISHHAQALRIVAVVANLLTDPQVKAIASRIEAVQRPEIDAMARWLTARGQNVPLEATYPLMIPGADHRAMPGMASTQQLEALARTSGPDTDRMFLTLMITHHEGALVMALEQRKNGTDDRATELSDDISVTQSAEIGHMRQMLARLDTAGAHP
jgi:uncharacterized protein (DUF305 family)